MKAITTIQRPILRVARKRGAPRKLAESHERRVVLAYWRGKVPVKIIALRFGISRTAVYDMVRRNPDLVPDSACIGGAA